jgi:hypothetical protein
MEVFGYIYAITCSVNDKVYIGQTIKMPSVRFQEHILNARRGMKYALYHAIRKYGAHNFHLSEVAVCHSQEELNTAEVRYIEQYDSLIDSGRGYNMTYGGEQGKLSPMAEKKRLAALLHPDTQEKIRERLASPDVKKRASESHKGFKASAETCAKLSAMRKGQKAWNANPSEEVRRMFRKAQEGHRPSELTFARAREANLINPPSRFRGHHHTEQSKEKTRLSMRAACKLRPLYPCPHCELVTTRAGLIVHAKFRHPHDS